MNKSLLKILIFVVIIGIVMIGTVQSEMDDNYVRAVIQATATVIQPIGITLPGDTILTSTPDLLKLQYDNNNSSPKDMSKLMFRFPSGSGLIVSVVTDDKELNRFDLPQKTQQGESEDSDQIDISGLSVLSLHRMLKDVSCEAKNCKITIIYTEN